LTRLLVFCIQLSIFVLSCNRSGADFEVSQFSKSDPADYEISALESVGERMYSKCGAVIDRGKH